MKKIILINAMILSILSLSNDKKIRITLKSNSEIEGRFNQSLKKANIKYVPVDLTIASRDNSLKANIVIQGNRKEISKPNVSVRYERDKLILNKVDVPKNTSDSNTSEDVWPRRSFEGRELGLKDRKIIQLGGHEHIPGVAHNHDHDHDHDHDHGGEFLGDSLNILKYDRTKNIYENEDIQAKLVVEYSKLKYGLKYSQYLTSFNEGEVKFFKNDAIIEGKFIKEYKDKFSIGLIPRIKTIKFKPSILELNTYLRYKANDNTFLGIELFNGVQVDSLKESINRRNKVKVYYDYNLEKRRAHKFWEILDHEHSKVEQFKIAFDFDNNYKAKKSLLNNTKLDLIENKNIYKLDLNLKKSDVFLKGLSISNDFNFKYEYENKKETEKKYDVKSYYLFLSEEDKNEAISKTGYLLKRKIERNSKTLFKDIKELKKGDKVRINNKDVTLENDGFEIIDHKLYEVANKSMNYYKKSIAVVNNEDEYSNSPSKKYTLNNSFNINYSKNKDNIDFNHKIKYFNENNKNVDEVKFENILSLNYERKLNRNLKLLLGLEDKFILEKENKYKVKIKLNTLSSKVGINYKYINGDLTLDLGLNNKFDLLSRNSSLHKLKNRKEANKWINGYEININPYIKGIYKPFNNLEINADLGLEKIFKKDSFRRTADGNFSSFERVSLPIKYNMKIGFTYRY